MASMSHNEFFRVKIKSTFRYRILHILLMRTWKEMSNAIGHITLVANFEIIWQLSNGYVILKRICNAIRKIGSAVNGHLSILIWVSTSYPNPATTKTISTSTDISASTDFYQPLPRISGPCSLEDYTRALHNDENMLWHHLDLCSLENGRT